MLRLDATSHRSDMFNVIAESNKFVYEQLKD